jgi:hypothetical protein
METVRRQVNFSFGHCWLACGITLAVGCGDMGDDGTGPMPDPDTTESPAAFTCNPGSKDVCEDGVARKAALQVGFNDRLLGYKWPLDPTHHDTDFAPAIQQGLAPQMIRFPGGTVGMWFDWDGSEGAPNFGTMDAGGTYCGPYGAALKTTPSPYDMSAGMDSVDQTFNHSLKKLSTEMDPASKEVLFDLNLLTSYFDKQNQMLQQAASTYGIPIRRVELGNELYLGSNTLNAGGSCHIFTAAYPRSSDYAAVANAWSAQLHAQYPGVKVAALANASYSDGTPNRAGAWNHDLRFGPTPITSDVDALTIHVYFTANGTACTDGSTMFSSASDFIGANIAKGSHVTEPTTSDPSGVDDQYGVLGNPSQYALGTSKKEIWVTEYGLLGGARGYWRKWGEGLGLLGYTMKLMADPRVTVLLDQQLIWALWSPGCSLDSSDSQGTLACVPYSPTGLGIAMRELSAMLRDANASASQTYHLNFSSNVQTKHSICDYRGQPFTYSTLQGWSAGADATKQTILANLDADTKTLEVSGIYPASSYPTVRVRTLSDDPDAYVLDGTVNTTDWTTVARVGGKLRIQLPPFSIVRLAP